MRDKKFIARTFHGNFVEMESQETLFRIFVTSTNEVILTRHQDFKAYNNKKLPNVSSLLVGVARQSELESMEGNDGQAEEGLIKAFQVYATSLPTADFKNRDNRRRLYMYMTDDSRLPQSFREAILSTAWREAIDCK